MKTLFTLIALGSVAFVSAGQYYQPYGNGSNYGESYYQNQPMNGYYYQPNQRQNSQAYYQNDGRNYQGNNQYDYQQSYGQNQQYYQQGNQPYYRDQQEYYDNSYGSQNNGNKEVSDQELNKKIQEKLSSGWFSKGFQNVSFDINNGNVTLRGSVDTLENKNKVEDSVRKIEGVKYVTNQITIVKESPNAYSETQLQDSEKKYPYDVATTAQDRQLNAKIRDKLSNGWFSKGYDTLVLRTTNGAIAITGNVDKAEDIQKISDQVKNVDGVRSVDNQVRLNNR